MDKNEFNEILNKVMDGGVEITMSKDKDAGVVWYDMNTQMKSHLKIALVEDKCVFEGRYDKKGEIKSYDDLLDEVSDCMYGRDFANQDWLDILEHRYDEPVVVKKNKP